MSLFSICCTKVIDSFKNSYISISFKILILVYLTFIIILNLTTPTTAYFVDEYIHNETFQIGDNYEENPESLSNDDENFETEYEDNNTNDSDEQEKKGEKSKVNDKVQDSKDSSDNDEDDNKKQGDSKNKSNNETKNEKQEVPESNQALNDE